MNPLKTDRLEIIPATAELIRCEIEAPPLLFAQLDVQPVPDWPPEALREVLPLFFDQLEQDSSLTGWLSWYWVCTTLPQRTLVGSGGFHGRPKHGQVEIGYETRPMFRRRGFATEAVDSLRHWALQDTAVQTIVAHVEPHNTASRRVLQVCGFVQDTTEPDANGQVRYKLKTHPA